MACQCHSDKGLHSWSHFREALQIIAHNDYTVLLYCVTTLILSVPKHTDGGQQISQQITRPLAVYLVMASQCDKLQLPRG